MVLANGSLANVNQASAPELYWALRGGSNNFGIVTRFDLETYSQGLSWGGYDFHALSDTDISARKAALGVQAKPFSLSRHFLLGSLKRLMVRAVCAFGYCNSVDQLIKSFVNFVEHEPDDNAQVIFSLGYAAHLSAYLGCTQRSYTKEEANPPAFDAFKSIVPLYSTSKIKNMASMSQEIDDLNPPGQREAEAHLFLP